MNGRTRYEWRTLGAALGALLSAGGSLVCCLPVAFLGAIGSAGASALFTAARPWLLLVSAGLIAVGVYQGYQGARCGVRQSNAALVLLAIALILVMVMTLAPQLVASVIADLLGGGGSE